MILNVYIEAYSRHELLRFVLWMLLHSILKPSCTLTCVVDIFIQTFECLVIKIKSLVNLFLASSFVASTTTIFDVKSINIKTLERSISNSKCTFAFHKHSLVYGYCAKMLFTWNTCSFISFLHYTIHRFFIKGHCTYRQPLFYLKLST